MTIKKLFKKETAIESAGITLVFRMLERVVQLFRGVIIARWLGPNEYGVLNLAFFFIPLIVALSKFGIPSSYSRYIPQYEKKNMLSDFLRRNYIITSVISVVSLIVTLLFSRQISILVYNSAEYRDIIILCSLFLLPQVLYENLVSSFKGMRIFKLGALLSFGQILLFSILAVILVLLYPRAQSSLTANLISMFLVSSFFGVILLKHVKRDETQKRKIDEEHFYGKIFRYSVWFVITPIVYTVFDYVDRLMLNRYLGLHEVGIYAVAGNITSLLFMFGMITGNVLMPNLSNMWEQGGKERAVFILNFSIKVVTLFVLGCAAFIVIFKKQIVLILYGSAYIDGLPIIPVLLIFWILHVIVWIAGSYPLLIEKTHLNFISIVPGLALNIILNYFLIPRYGIMGAAAATTFSYILLLSSLLLLSKMEKMDIGLRTVFICLTPAILIFNNAIIIVGLILLAVLSYKTNLIIIQEEKAILAQETKNLYQRLTKSFR